MFPFLLAKKKRIKTSIFSVSIIIRNLFSTTVCLCPKFCKLCHVCPMVMDFFLSRIRYFKINSINPKILVWDIIGLLVPASKRQQNSNYGRNLNRSGEKIKNFCLRPYHLSALSCRI